MRSNRRESDRSLEEDDSLRSGLALRDEQRWACEAREDRRKAAREVVGDRLI